MARQIVTQEMQQAEREKRLAQARNILPTATGGAAKAVEIFPTHDRRFLERESCRKGTTHHRTAQRNL